MPGRLTPQSTVNDFQWRLDVSITLRQSESDADIRTNGQWESAKCSRCAFNPVNTSGVYWGFHPAITVNDGTYETLFIHRVCSLHRSCKYSVARLDGSASSLLNCRITPVDKLERYSQQCGSLRANFFEKEKKKEKNVYTDKNSINKEKVDYK